jgi:adenylate kinase
MNIALIGPSGVGKGTQADKLVAKFNLVHLVTGELFREKLENRRAIGLLAKKYMARGELAPDELVDAMVEEWLWDAPPDKDILFDGFPRTRYQARFLDDLFSQMNRRLEAVIYLEAPDEVIIERLLGRLICQRCQSSYHLKYHPPAVAGICDRCGGALYQRPDDILPIIRVRLRAFHRVTESLLHYYRDTDRLILVDGSGEVDQVSQALIEAVEAVQRQEAKMASREDVAEMQLLKRRAPFTEPAPGVRQGLNLVLIGGPGSGKGTQAEYFKHELKLQHISTGDLFRENIKNNTELGRLAKTYIDRGELVPDEVTEAMVEERLARPNTEAGFVLDGFPRTLPQAEALTEILNHLQRRLDGVLYIKVSDAEIIKRLSGRLICKECQCSFHTSFNPFKRCPYNKCQGEYLYQRDDDNPETVKNRLRTFHSQTLPLLNYFQDAGLLIEINGEGEVEEVKDRVKAVVKRVVIA